MKQSPQLQTCFLVNKKESYFKRFWIVRSQNEYKDMLNQICNIDMIAHPQIKAFPCIYELENRNNSPELVEVSEVYFQEVLENTKNELKSHLNDYELIFNKKIILF